MEQDIVDRLRVTARLEKAWYANVGRRAAKLICEEAEEAALLIESLRKQTQWHPIETAPHGVDLILYCPDRGITNEERIECRPYSTGKRIGNASSISYHSWATHWQHLPPAPPEQQEPAL